MHHSPSRDAAVEEIDEPLPATLAFVMALGGSILIGWFAMFWLLQERW